MTDAVGQVFKEYIESSRKDFTSPKITTRKRLPVEPGKSISSEEVSRYLEESASKKKSVNKESKGKQVKLPATSKMAVSSSDTEDDDEIVFDDSTDTATEEESDVSSDEQCTSLQSTKKINKDADTETVYVVSDFVVVNYEGTTFPGEITEVNAVEKEVKVSCMERAGKGFWKWPKVKDETFYVSDIIERLDRNCVKQVSKRGIFLHP